MVLSGLKVISATMALSKWHFCGTFACECSCCQIGNNAFGIITDFVLFVAGIAEVDD